MSDKIKPKNYELVLEGFENDSPQTLQKVKGILIGNLELSIPEVQKILESYPLTIKRSESETDLSVHYNSLKSAGAKVLLLKEGATYEENTGSSSNEIEFSLEPFSTPSNDIKEGEEGQSAGPEEIEFELNLDDAIKPANEEAAPAGAYELNLNEDPQESLKELEEELGESLQLSPQKTPSTETTPPDEFSLDLQPATAGLELIDSPALANVPEDDGEWEADNLSQSLASENYSGQAAKHEITKPEAIEESKISKIEQSLLQLEETESSETEKKTAPAAASGKTTEKAQITLEVAEGNTKEAPVTAPETTKQEPTKAVQKNTVPQKEAEIPKTPPPAASTPPPPNSATSVSANSTAVIASPAIVTSNSEASSKLKKSPIPTDLLVPILVGGILLGVVNWFYFSTKEEKKAAVQPKIEIPEVTVNVEVTANTAEVVEAPVFPYQGEIAKNNIQAKLQVSASTDKVQSIKFDFSSEKPAELSPEEIVQQIPVRVWLRKAEIDKAVFTKNKDGSHSAKVPVKFYFEQGEQRERIIGEAAVVVSQTETGLKASIIVEHNLSLQESGDLVTAKDEAGKFAAAFSLEIDLVKIEQTSPETEEANTVNVEINPSDTTTQPSS